MKSADAYEKAYRDGQQCYKQRVLEGKNPYLPVLDTITEDNKIRKNKPWKLKEISLDRVVGTKTGSRTEAFAANFMPLLKSGTEFAAKWENVYSAQIEEGLRDPIKVYELFGRYFVEEGNKRVSVLKFCKAASVMAEVREIVLETKDTKAAEIYQAFLNFQNLTGTDVILMSNPKNYNRLEKVLNVDTEHPFTEAETEDFEGQFKAFETAFNKMGGRKLRLSSGDAFLLYLDYYGFQKNNILTPSKIEKELKKIWPDLEIYPHKRETTVLTDTDTSEKKKILSLRTSPLKVAFIENTNAKSSSWTKEHIVAIEKIRKELGHEIDVTIYDEVNSEEEQIQALEEAIKKGNELIFTDSPEMLRISNQFAAAYPKVKILNCSLNTNTGKLRTFYSRDFEIQLLLGLIAGALTQSHHIGYIASYPIYGTAANINAFAIGVAMVNPNAEIFLDWSTTQEATVPDFPLDIDIIYIEGEKFDLDSKNAKASGLFDVRSGKFINLAKIETHWDVFYRKIIKAVLNNSYSVDEYNTGNDSINYWWGLSNGLLDVNFSEKMPAQLERLIRLVKDSMASSMFSPFKGDLVAQDGTINHMDQITLLDLAQMDWLNQNIVGSIPKDYQMLPEAEQLVNVHGLHTVKEEEQ
ncbi:BMP family ABC transporter substrate-binding protein [Ileibacterium valens]|uniref:ABC transporter substrate-binding protein PnrA-like domain-containing protein n=1 Tax=Ileibacterium valens TaxID=1862668 RepID=A0A1U7NCW9_9FIRM|nr:BMP family ABC transporter substrate-binding protein [Ileibacterium valens]OLU36482.1 hypothetical protein BO224_12335 [Erysipelotrichaceae bacterium NYU-BL-E8]OLU36575.1 hypothetical protein BO222_12160 [Ileibacterium valens]OLU43448.1 hypothetical protein BM735_00355 [Erysipelotrichaceae bacterium NYU-BL-F16]